MRTNVQSHLAVLAPISGRSWQIPEPATSDIAAQIVLNRGLCEADITRLKDQKLASHMPNPSVITDMDKAAEMLAKAVTDGLSIHLHADYDVDGATSSAILRRYLAACGHKWVKAEVPNREYGYGFGNEAADNLFNDPPDLLVLLDCGTHNLDTIAQARSYGIDVIVVDHHQPGHNLPLANALINPHRPDETEQGQALRILCTAGLAFMLTIATTRALRQHGYWQQREEPAPRLLLDLAALGTVCDVMPLTGLNRALVQRGLDQLRRQENTGLAALCAVAGVKDDTSVTSLGFHLGPRINAGGRIGNARLGSDLLSSDDPALCRAIAATLNGLNQDRQTIEAAVRTEAEAQIDPDDDIVLVCGEGWHEGVIGIVASRLRELTRKPTIIMAANPDGIVKGSGRSMHGVNLGEAMLQARAAGLLDAGGGHAMACGLTTTLDRLPALRAFLVEHFSKAAAKARLADSTRADAILHANDITKALIQTIDELGPYGQGWARPRFVIGPCTAQSASLTAKGHLFCTLADETGGIKAKAWRANETDALTILQSNEPFYALVTIELDTWNGRNTPNATIEDVARVSRNVASG